MHRILENHDYPVEDRVKNGNWQRSVSYLLGLWYWLYCSGSGIPSGTVDFSSSVDGYARALAYPCDDDRKIEKW
jgi:hypothetical protein